MTSGTYYDRYASFRTGSKVRFVPFIKIAEDGNDLYIEFRKNSMRFDNLSYKYYGDANYGWLILQANPHLGGYEFSIPDRSTIRIPYPLSSAIKRYEQGIVDYEARNGS